MKKADAPAQSRWISCRSRFEWTIFLLGGSCLLALIASTVRAQTLTFTTLAGPPGGPGSTDGTGSSARLSFPSGVAADSGGNVYVADKENSTIRKISAAGVVTTLAGLAGARGSTDAIGGAARFDHPLGVATDGGGNVYVADTGNSTIRKISPAGRVTTLAGSAHLDGSSDGNGSAARFKAPFGVATDSAGNVYVADTANCTIRKITPAGFVTTLAGEPGIRGSADGIGSAARFDNPQGVTAGNAGNVYVADSFSHTIREITPAGVVTTIAGSPGARGSADGFRSAARFDNPQGVATDSARNVYVADSFSHTIRKITPAGVVSTVAGSANNSGGQDGTSLAARFNTPSGVATDGSGNVYVADTSNSTIRKISAAGIVTTLAGSAASRGSADGPASTARFNGALGVATDSSGNVYVADSQNATIRKITPAGTVVTLAGAAGLGGSADGIGTTARFRVPAGVATDSAGNVYVADLGNRTIRKINPAGVVTTLAGVAGLAGSADGIGSDALFDSPQAVATDSAGNVYVADANNTIRKITPARVVTTLAGSPGLSGSADGAGSAARFFTPLGLATDLGGNIYVADTNNSTIRKITPAGVVTTLAGSAPFQGSSDGSGSAARFTVPQGLATDSGGNLYVSDGGNNTIRMITPEGVVTTLAGSVRLPGSEDGTGGAARFNSPHGVATDSAGIIYLTDGLSKIRIGRPALADVATIDLPIAQAGATRQLNTSPQSATSWQWRIIRQPSGSTAALSSTSIRNPVFTPDVADLYVFALTASNGVNTSITTVSLTVPTRRRAVRH